MHEDRLFLTEGIGAPPDHLHCIWTLPADDLDFPTRWHLINALFVRQIRAIERLFP
jgi:putative transposase